jgi:hypothetical protein
MSAKAFTALLLLWAAVVAAPTDAAKQPRVLLAQQNGATLYGVEMIVFRSANAGPAEDWNAVPVGHGFGAATSRGGPAPQVVRVRPASEYLLGGVESRLHTSGAWRPIAHAAWIQTAANWGTQIGIPLSDIGINVPELSGMVYLERAPIYLHLGFDLKLSAAATYAIKEMRSVR